MGAGMSADSGIKKGVVALKINEDLRIVMVGRTGTGKSRSANTILGRDAFESKLSIESLTVDCKEYSVEVNGRNVLVVDTPGVYDTKSIQEIKRCISLAAPGPHVFLIVLRIGRFFEKEVENIRELFGDTIFGYALVLFTGGDYYFDDDDDETIETYFKDIPKLEKLVRECGDRYHVFNNRSKDPSQVTELLEKINNMMLKNGGSHYTNEMLQDAEEMRWAIE